MRQRLEEPQDIRQVRHSQSIFGISMTKQNILKSCFFKIICIFAMFNNKIEAHEAYISECKSIADKIIGNE